MSNGKAKSLEEAIAERGWSISAPAKNGSHGQKRRTHAEKTLEELETYMNVTSSELTEERLEKPGAILKKMITVQGHLDARFAAKRNPTYAAYLTARQAISRLLLFSQGYEAVLCKKDVTGLMLEQRGLTELLMGYFSGSKKRMAASHESLQEQRLEAVRQFQKEGTRYDRIEKELEQLGTLDAMVAEQSSRSASKPSLAAEMLYVQGNLLVEKQRLSTESAEAAIKSFGAFNRAKEIQDYQLTVMKATQVLTNAYGNLEEVAAQQEIAQSVLASFVEGESSIAAANEVVNALSANIIGTSKTINDAATQLKQLAQNIGTKRASSENANDGVGSLYSALNKTNKGTVAQAHEFMRQMREKPVSELVKVHYNGSYSTAKATG